MDAIELHIFTKDKDKDIEKLAQICEVEEFSVIRLFWRNVEAEEEQNVN